MPTSRKATTPSAKRRVPDLNQEVANALGASTGTRVPEPEPEPDLEPEDPKQAAEPRPKSSE